jgi:hypothetical protein
MKEFLYVVGAEAAVLSNPILANAMIGDITGLPYYAGSKYRNLEFWLRGIPSLR